MSNGTISMQLTYKIMVAGVVNLECLLWYVLSQHPAHEAKYCSEIKNYSIMDCRALNES